MTALQRQEKYEAKKQRWNQAYDRAVCSPSARNHGIVVLGFMAKGIPQDDIIPRVNVFTFDAWKSQGRFVRKGEHGVSVPVVYTKDEKESEPQYDENEMEIEPGKSKSYRILTGATVFHVSQTEEMKIKGA